MRSHEKDKYKNDLVREVKAADIMVDFIDKLALGVMAIRTKWDGKKCNARYFQALDTAIGGTPEWKAWHGGYWSYESFSASWASYSPHHLDFTPKKYAGPVTLNDLATVRVPTTDDDRIDSEAMLDALNKCVAYWKERQRKLKSDLARFDELYAEMEALMKSVADFKDKEEDFFRICDGFDGWGYRP